MSYFGFIIYQLLILFTCYHSGFSQEFEYNLALEQVSVDGVVGFEGRTWQFVELSKVKQSDNFIFRNDELRHLCGDTISWANVEITELFDTVVRFSLVRETSAPVINLTFLDHKSVVKFFAEIRWRQRSGCGKELFKVKKLFQYHIAEERVQLLAESAAVYTRNLKMLARPRTINFAQYRFITPAEDVYLVLQSRKFNFSVEICPRMYILCTSDIKTHRFVVLFPDDKSVSSVFTTSSIAQDLNHDIPCPTDSLPFQVLQQLYFFCVADFS